ncbi:hypothetical protein ACFOZ0_26320 [Streptomyces yaanensis]|uniref:Uncharacterized protein n=1 Tax=Streptomyces yaanensis TaxID=1142239 RepID=A0ABV7SJR0_9ACTN|nr:hypothetical protein [Streptomyces sp. CGMCC 4.7035]WNC01692.1 hypothetical protein Q2K21_28525 [Streptomyces sp. CGMCC 4.7035]
MSEIEELRRRLEALEARVDEVAAQQATTRNLALDSDRDVAALQEQRQADMRLIRAVRDTQLEHGKTLEAHTRTLAEHGKLLGALVSGQVAMMEQLQAITDHLGSTPPDESSEA